MHVKLRHYTDQPGFTQDFFRVRDFLMRIHKPGYADQNWLWARWEYMFSHPILDETHLSRIGVWEDEGKTVALANYEDNLGAAYFSLDSGCPFLKEEMIEYAKEQLSVTKEDGTRSLRAVINDDDTEMREIAGGHGFTITERRDPMSEFRVSGSFLAIALPEGFSIVSLADENDLYKIERVLWRGFNHPGDPPSDYIPGRLKMQSGPDFRKDLTIAVKAPNGDFVSFCGMWYLRCTDYAYVEPVATESSIHGYCLERGNGCQVGKAWDRHPCSIYGYKAFLVKPDVQDLIRYAEALTKGVSACLVFDQVASRTVSPAKQGSRQTC